MLTQMAKESGVETPSADDLVRIDRTRKGKKPTMKPDFVNGLLASASTGPIAVKS